MWAVLLITLPTQPNAVRLRIWRALKVLGCVSLRDGVYLLPEEHAAQLEALGQQAREHGGEAAVLRLSPRDAAQQADVLARFDRADAYAQWRDTLAVLQRELAGLGEVDARRRVRSAGEDLQAVIRIDYYAGAAAEQARWTPCARASTHDSPGVSRSGRPTTASRGSTPRSSRASAGPPARGPGSTGWPVPG